VVLVVIPVNSDRNGPEISYCIGQDRPVSGLIDSGRPLLLVSSWEKVSGRGHTHFFNLVLGKIDCLCNLGPKGDVSRGHGHQASHGQQ